MEEIKELHQLNIEWGCITNLLDRIITLEDKIEGGWPELIDMVGDAMTLEAMNKNPVTAFFNLYGFMFRLYYRVKDNPVKQPFNRWSYNEKSSWFMVNNYDYKTYCWLIEKKLADGVSTGYATIPEEKLDETQKELLKRRCK